MASVCQASDRVAVQSSGVPDLLDQCLDKVDLQSRWHYNFHLTDNLIKISHDEQMRLHLQAGVKNAILKCFIIMQTEHAAQQPMLTHLDSRV